MSHCNSAAGRRGRATFTFYRLKKTSKRLLTDSTQPRIQEPRPFINDSFECFLKGAVPRAAPPPPPPPLFLISSGGKCDIMSMPWVKTNVCGGTCFSVVTEAGSRVPSSPLPRLLPPSCPLWVISMWQHSFSVLQFSFGLFYRSLFPLFFFCCFCCFPLTLAFVVFAWRQSASAAFSGTGWEASANGSLSFHRITTMFQFV